MHVWRLSAIAYSTIAIVGGVALMALSVAMKNTPLQVPLSGVAVAWGIAGGGLAWTRLDEAGREAHKFASFHGAFGLLAALLAAASAEFSADPLGLVRIVNDMAHTLVERVQAIRHVAIPESVAGFNLGVMFASLAWAAVYLAVWCGWWIARRRR